MIKNTELELEKQKLHINEEYYIELEKQYDSSNILIHDIKKCLGNIKGLLLQNDNSKAIEYIDSIYDGYDIKQIKKYSNNKLINVIVSRYAQLCYNNNIEFSADIRDVNFSFIKDSEITALFDNLFENAFEATKKCPNKFINIEVDYRNENYIFIKMLNSINNKPLFQNGVPITTKKDKKGHGIGIKSILKIVKKYHGNLDYTYIENAEQYEFQYSEQKSFKDYKKLYTTPLNNKTFGTLTINAKADSGKEIYVRVRAINKEKGIMSPWSEVKSVKLNS